MNIPGKIFSEQAYARAKMLDNSGWLNVLPRGSTPSDLDVILDSQGHITENTTVIDNKGNVVFIEYNTSKSHWEDISYGQRLAYQNILLPKPKYAILAHVQPRVGQPIDTLRDVIDFQVMAMKDGCEVVYGKHRKGHEFEKAVIQILNLWTNALPWA